jgi:hypothetical protein
LSSLTKRYNPPRTLRSSLSSCPTSRKTWALWLAHILKNGSEAVERPAW